MSYISYPFTLDSIGVVKTTDYTPKIYLDRLLTLLSTNVGQRPMNPGYGVDLKTALFENAYIVDGPQKTTFSAAVKSAIETAVNNWLPDISLGDIKVGPIGEDGIAAIEIVVVLPNSTQATLSTTTAIFTNDGTITRTA